MTRWELFLLGWGVALALLAVLYVRQLRTRDATRSTRAGGAAIAVLALLYVALGPGATRSRSC